jgi:heat shock protein HtpX
LSQLDLNHDGVISAEELQRLKNNDIRVARGGVFMELLSTHPDMLKRIKRLADYS